MPVAFAWLNACVAVERSIMLSLEKRWYRGNIETGPFLITIDDFIVAL
jgi:hypothetical protein